MTQRYATVSADGRVTGFYADDITPEIPTGAIEISEEIYAEWVANAMTRAWINGALVETDPLVTPDPEPRPQTVITAREFRERFTRAERGAITLAASKALAADDPTLQVFLDDLTAAQVVELDHPDLLAGMSLLVTLDLLTQARATEILDAAV